MAELLSPWLAKQLREHLQLALNWLDRHLAERQSAAAFSDPLLWDKLYKDDGHSLRIFVPHDPGKRRNVQVLKPTANSTRMNLSDGRQMVPATFSESCLREFKEQYKGKEVVNGCLLALRKFTIIASTLDDALAGSIELLVETLDWQGTVNGHQIGHPEPIMQDDRFKRLMHQLQQIRVRGSEEVSSSDGSGADQPYQGFGRSELTIDSQVPFATQAPNIFKPAKQRPLGAVETDVPWKAQEECDNQNGSTRQRGEVGREDLLSLLRRANPPPHQMAKEYTDTAANPPGSTKTKRYSSENAVTAKSGTPCKAKKKVESVQVVSLNPASDVPRVHTRQEEQAKVVNENDYHTPGCDWMHGLRLSRAALTIPADQRALLSSDESWLPSLPGKRFPGANVPIKMLTRLNELANRSHSTTDQTVDTDLDETVEVVGSASEISSSDSEIPQESEHRPSSVVSWSPSPTPEPPQRSRRIEMDLPPDSSLPEASDTPDSVHLFGRPLVHATRTDQVSKTPRKETSPRGSLKPLRETGARVSLRNDQTLRELPKAAASVLPIDMAADSSPMVQSTTDVVIRPAAATLYSPPGPRSQGIVMDLSQSDDDLEVVVPHGLGEDHELHRAQSSFESKQPNSDSVISGISHNEATVLVKETPNVKGKSAVTITIQAPASSSSKQASSGQSRETCSTYVVHSTYDDLKMAPGGRHGDDGDSGPSRTDTATIQVAEEEQGEQEHSTPVRTTPSSRPPLRGSPLLARKDPPAPKEKMRTGSVQPSPPPPQTARESSVERAESRVPTRSPRLVPCERPPRISPTPKRKLSVSPSENKSHQTKRRALKTVDLHFSQEPVLSQDPSAATLLQKQRWLQSYRQNSADRSIEKSVDAIVPNSAASVRLPFSTDAGQVVKPGIIERNIVSHSEPNKVHQPVQDITSSVGGTPITGSNARPAPVRDKRTPPVDLTPAPPAVLPAIETAQSFCTSDPPTVFSKFKTEYPAYTGDSKHFLSMCMAALELEKEDKMVPKWQWDDYIARSEIDYPQYVEQCKSEGTEPVLYHRFYKDHTRGIVFEKGVVSSTATLEKAINELNTRRAPVPSDSRSTVVPARRRLVSPTDKGRNRKRTRLSLPWAQEPQSNELLPEPKPSVQPRHSLPPLRPAGKLGRDFRPPRSPLAEPVLVENGVRNKIVSHASSLSHKRQDGRDGQDNRPASDGKLTQFVVNFERLTCFTGDTSTTSNRTLTIKPPRRRIDAFQWPLGSDDI